MLALNPLTRLRRSRGDDRLSLLGRAAAVTTAVVRAWPQAAAPSSARAPMREPTGPQSSSQSSSPSIGTDEAHWLQRVLLSCFGLTVSARERLPAVDGLRDLAGELARRGLALRSARLRDVRELRRGDVLRLDASATGRLCAAVEGEGLAVVVDDGLQWVRLRASCCEQPLTCARVALRGLRGARLLRVEPDARVRSEDSRWDSRADSCLDSCLDSRWTGVR